uniref:Uncharacterized protein n=1 Tax=viral metagenome TaxID=1070528 RepID=A0A6H1Z8U1_9ZZZZ
MYTESIIRRLGKSYTKVGSAMNTTFYGIIQGTKTSDIQNRHNIFEVIPDLTLDKGDIIRDGSRYYLVVTAEDHVYQGGTEYSSNMLLFCNVNAIIKRYVNSVLTTIKSDVRCVVSKSRLVTADDDRLYQDRFYSGIEPINFAYMSADEPIQKDDIIIDGSRTLRVLNDISPYIISDVVELQVIEMS